jgi:ribosome-binding protein aMBF1 (putative translation factor)
MDGGFIEGLVDYGALGLFVIFLIWRDTRNQKRIDEMLAKFNEQTLDLEAAHVAAESEIRDRYDKIVARHDAKKDAIYADVVKKLDDHTRILEDIESGLQGPRSLIVRD